MKFLKMLKFSIMIYSIMGVNCCNKKDSKVCKDIYDSQYCAHIYLGPRCTGNKLNIRETEDIIDFRKKIFSVEVKEGCILSGFYAINSHTYGSRLVLTGPEDDIGYFYRAPTWVSGIDMRSVWCQCNKYHGCPNPKSLPPTTSSGKSNCATVYQHSTGDPLTSCFGNSKEVFNGEKMPRFTGKDLKWQIDISSIVVKEGCTFTGYENTGYSGFRKSFKGVNVKLGQIDNRILSYQCKCEFPPIVCKPSVIWERVTRCRNLDAHAAEFSCSYWKSSGFTSSNTETDLSEQSRTVIKNIGLKLKEIFTANYQVSSGWSTSSSKAFTYAKHEEEKHIETISKIPAGKQYAVYQRVGVCGDYKIYEDDYELRDEANQAVIRRQ